MGCFIHYPMRFEICKFPFLFFTEKALSVNYNFSFFPFLIHALFFLVQYSFNSSACPCLVVHLRFVELHPKLR